MDNPPLPAAAWSSPADAVEAEALGALTARLTAALALLASSSTAVGPSLTSATSSDEQQQPGSHAASASDAWDDVLVRVVVEPAQALSARSSSSASSAFRVTLCAEPARGLPRQSVASFVAGVFAGGGAVAALASPAPPHQASCFDLSTAMAGERTLRTYSWRALPSPLAQRAQLGGGGGGGGGGGSGGGGGGQEEKEGEGEGEGSVAWAMVGARRDATPKAQRGLLHSFVGTSIAFTWSPVVAAASRAARMAAAGGRAASSAAAAEAVHPPPSGGSVVEPALPHPPALRGLPWAMRTLIEVLPEGAAITLQLPPPPPSTALNVVTAPTFLPPPPQQPLLQQPPALHHFMRRPLRAATPHAARIMNDGDAPARPPEMTARGSASGARHGVPWSVDVAVVLKRTTTSMADVDVPGRCHVYVNLAVQPSADAREVVDLVFMKSPGWWDDFNLPPLCRGVGQSGAAASASMPGTGTAGAGGRGAGSAGGGGGSAGADAGGGAGGAGTSAGVAGDGQTFLAFYSTPDTGNSSGGGSGGSDESARRTAAAREAAGARAVAVITGDGDEDEGDDGDGGYQRHVYHVSEIVIHLVGLYKLSSVYP
jgi:hypothetical protein